MSTSFPYRRALVTGASRGLGAAFARALLGEGVEVLGTSRSGKGFEVEGVQPLALDLAEADSLSQLMAELTEGRHGKIDLLVNNAGFGAFGDLDELGSEAVQAQLAVLLEGPIRLCQAVLPAMRREKHGCLLNVASLAASFPLPYCSLYNAAKAGLSNFSRSLAIELDGSGVVVIDFQPGDYKTDFNASMQPGTELGEGRKQAAWQTLEKNISEAPPVSRAAEDLLAAIRAQRSGLCASGSAFQARIAPLLARLGSRRLVDGFLKSYFGLK